MVNKELSDFVQQSLAKGDSREQITSTLIQQGWQSDQINEAFLRGNVVHSRKPLYIGIAVLILLLVGGGAFALYHKKSDATSSNQKEGQLYAAGTGDDRISFRYPKEYCVFEEGGINVVYGADCYQADNEKKISILFLPALEDNPDEYIKIFDSEYTDTGIRRTIGTYEAHKLNSNRSSGTGWIFIPKKGLVILISSHLGDTPGHAEAEEMILNSMAFGDKAESYPANASPKAENFNPTGGRAIGFIGRPDISPDDTEIIFSYSHDGSSVNLYTANTDGSNVKKLDPAKKPDRYFPIEPRYSRDGKKILFVSRNEGLYGPKGIAYIMNRDGSDLHAITKDNENVLEAVFSTDNQAIYYLRSNSWRNYNGMAPDLPHEIDLYRVNLDRTGYTQLTTNKDYELKGLSLSPDEKLLAAGYRTLSLQNNPPSFRNIGSCAGNQEMFQFYPKERYVLCIAGSFEGKGILWKMALDIEEHEWKPLSVQQTYLYPPVFFHSKNTILFFEHDGAFPQKILSLNLDEALTTSPLPDADRDPRTKEIPLVIPKN